MTITTPVDIGQTVWFIENNLVQSGELLNITIEIATNQKHERVVSFRYTIHTCNPIELARTNRCFQTKAELLASL